MKKLTFSLLLGLVALTGFSTTWTVTNSGFNFSPATITIASGDTVMFNIDNIHTVLEVSEATWNANDNTPLPGGFGLPFGGGMLLPDDLSEGTHFYVCEPHASMGMKGRIIVEGSSATDETLLRSDIALFPNPTKGKFQVLMGDTEFAQNFDLEIYDSQGKIVFSTSKFDPKVIHEIDLSDFENGMYFIKLYGDTEIYCSKIVVQ